MNNFNPFNNMYYQFWMVPNYIQPRPTYYTPVTLYSQMVCPPVRNLIIQNVIQNPVCNLPVTQHRNQQKVFNKSSNSQSVEKQEPEKVTANSQTNLTKTDLKKIQVRVANRPQTYLTQKAFYMKQKLKGKNKTGIRILRRRIKYKQQKQNKIGDASNVQKKQLQLVKFPKKVLPIAKDSEKQRKIVNKIKLKLSKQNLKECAQIPKLISGVLQLNDFCKKKIESLMLRQFTQA